MNRISLPRALVFICILAFIATALYAWQYGKERRKAAEMTAAKAEQDAANAHARFMTQYEISPERRTSN